MASIALSTSEASGGATGGGFGEGSGRSGPPAAGRARGRTALVVTTRPDAPTCAELERLAATGERPRKDYVELAKLLDADVIDVHHMDQKATRLARATVKALGLPAGQIVEALATAHRYEHVCAWADRLGLPLALLYKLGRVNRDLVLISVWLSSKQKAPFLKNLKVHSHLRAIINYGSVQAEIAAGRLGVPRSKLHLALQPVDEIFWQCREPAPRGNTICAVGWEHRDYPTLLEAVRGLDVSLEIAVGTVSMFEPAFAEGAGGLPPNVKVHLKLDAAKLRDLYERSRLVVIPVQDVEFDAGVTAMGEAMAMSRPLVVTRTRGQGDTLVEGVHGHYVPPADARAMRAAIEAVMSDPEGAARMGRAGRDLVEQRLTLDRYLRQVASVIEGTAPDPRDEPTSLAR